MEIVRKVTRKANYKKKCHYREIKRQIEDIPVRDMVAQRTFRMRNIIFHCCRKYIRINHTTEGIDKSQKKSKCLLLT